MRKEHELPKGIICEKCLKKTYKGNYKKISILEPIIYDTTGKNITTNRINLCNKCFLEFENLLKNFLKIDNI